MKENIEKVPPITSYGECTQPNIECKYRKDGKCHYALTAIHFCREYSDQQLKKAGEFTEQLPELLKQIAGEIAEENTTVFVVSSKFCGDFFVDAAFSTKQQAEDFITQHEMSSGYITELTIDKPSEYTQDLPFRPTPKQDERVNHPKHYQHPSGVECITIARHHDFNTGSALKYLWRAGLKEEQGLTPLEKQIEDIQKAVWFLQDEIKFLQEKQKER